MSGYVAGVELGGYLDAPQAFANLFFRCARGIAAYDPLQTFGGLEPVAGNDASDCRVALSANLELGAVALQLGAYLREFRDPSATATTGGKLEEGIVDARPYVWLGQRAGFAVDASYQALRTLAVNPSTGRLVGGAVGKFALIPFYSPYGRGTYTRPQLQLIYALSVRNDDAQRLYPDLDRRSSSSVEQFFAIGAEWWFNSTSY
jgi:maltoporin